MTSTTQPIWSDRAAEAIAQMVEELGGKIAPAPYPGHLEVWLNGKVAFQINCHASAFEAMSRILKFKLRWNR